MVINIPKKTDKEYVDFEGELTLSDLSREGVRKQLFAIFLNEKGGHREGEITHATRYRYNVETLRDGRRIYLKRPARLNKGIDVEIWVEKFDGDKDRRPTHGDVLTELAYRKAENQSEYQKLIKAIKYVYEGGSPDEIMREHRFDFGNGYSNELLLKLVKWHFIEQDLTYWNWEGRNMLMRGIL